MRAAFEHIQELVEQASDVPGDFAEAGVWRGDTCEPLARWAHLLGKKCWAFDSFKGMAAPGPRDAGHYPVGTFSGADVSAAALAARCGTAAEALVVIEGWVPGCFRLVPAPQRFAFVHVDLDQYQPQLAALEFFWDRMSPGGILCAHDWMPGRGILASAAFDEFAVAIDRRPLGPAPSNHGWFIK